MLCTNCGKDIPFAGNVCPHCHTDKSKDQGKDRRLMATTWKYAGAWAGICAVFAGIFGLGEAGNSESGRFIALLLAGPAAVFGGLIGMFMGTVAGAAEYHRASK